MKFVNNQLCRLVQPWSHHARDYHIRRQSDAANQSAGRAKTPGETRGEDEKLVQK